MYRVIYEHHPKKGLEQQFIESWQRGSDFIQTYPGALGTKLFRSVDNAEVLYAIAEWESVEARDTAMKETKKLPDSENKLKGHEQFVDEVKIIANLDLIARSDPPEK